MKRHWMEKFVIPNISSGDYRWFHDYALKAYEDKYYFEATVVLHTTLTANLRALVYLYRHSNRKLASNKVWNEIEKLSLKDAARLLLVNGKITENDYEKIGKFNNLRNTVIHEFLNESAEGDHRWVPMPKFKKIFMSAYKLTDRFILREPKLATRKSRARRRTA